MMVWKYRGEGGSSLVVTNTETCKVYRLPTKKCDEKLPQNFCVKKVRKNHEFVRNVMLTLLGPQYVRPGKLVDVSEAHIREMMQTVKKSRAERRLSREVDISSTVTLTLPDLCYVLDPLIVTPVPTFSIEIKPKKGFMPVQSSVCYFCMHQYLKKKEGMWPTHSFYCPLDLFSGNHKRMRHALKCLLNTPQNNLKIFKDGDLIWGSDVAMGANIDDHLDVFTSTVNASHSNIESFLSCLISCLTHTTQQSSSSSSTSGILSNQKCANSTFHSSHISQGDGELPAGCILEKLLRFQQLAGMDIVGDNRLLQLHNRLTQHLAEHPSDRDLWKLEGPYDQNDWLNSSSSLDEDDGSVEYAVLKMKQFVIARSLQDCSIMVAMQPLDNRDIHEDLTLSSSCWLLETVEGQTIQFSVSLLDLDPKRWQKIPEYMELEQSIAETYSLAMAAKKRKNQEDPSCG